MWQRRKAGNAISKTLSEAIANRPVFEWNNIQGTLVGFWFPEYVGSVNIQGFHLHFISTDETKAFKTKVFDLTHGYNKPLSPTSSK